MAKVAPISWPKGWTPVTDVQRAALTTQLLVEMGGRSDLARHVVEVAAVSKGRGDVVIAMRNWTAPYAVAHLVWDKPDRRNWLARLFLPRPRAPVALVPLARLADLAR